MKDLTAWAANFNGAILNEANCARAELSGTLFKSAYLSYAKLNGATLGQAGIGGWLGENLTSKVLRGETPITEFIEEIFAKALNFAGADLTKAIAHGADFRSAHMTECCLQGADLAEADMRRAKMQRSDLRGADLTGSRFGDADLTEAIRSRDSYITQGWKVEEGTDRLFKEL
jgi:uncharacterized protein YjbI with pentapeptide repeats